MICDKIISLGSGCDVDFALEQLNLTKYRGESLIFNWVSSIIVDDIIFLIDTQFKNINVEFKQTGPNISKFVAGNMCHIQNTDICTGHYNIDNYREIVKRRSQRFLSILTTTDNILFIRKNIQNIVMSKDKAIKLEKSILKINNSLNFHIIIIECLSNINDFKPFKTEYSHNVCIPLSSHPKDGKWCQKTIECWRPVLQPYFNHIL